MNYLLIIFCLMMFDVHSQDMVLTPSLSAEEYVKVFTENGKCTSYSTASFSGKADNSSICVFTRSATNNFPFAKGVLLSTNDASLAALPYPSSIDGNDMTDSWGGDTDLENAIAGTQPNSTVDATVLEFDFVAIANSFSFRYIFASNEYTKYYPCKYSDPFAILIKEKNSAEPYVNIAVLPDNTPVSSQTVRPTIPKYTSSDGSVVEEGCPAQNESYFKTCPNDYKDGCNTTYPINFAGQTNVMTATKNDLIIGKTYHIKIVIADGMGSKTEKNPTFDSAIYLEAGSFKPYVDLGKNMDGSPGNEPKACMNVPVVLKADSGVSAATGVRITYQWDWYAAHIVDATTNTLAIPVKINNEDKYSGTYFVKENVNYTSTSGSTPIANCLVSGKIIVEYIIIPSKPVANAEIKECDVDGDGFTKFNLNNADKTIINGIADASSVEYYLTKAEAMYKKNVIETPKSYQNISNPQILHTRVMSEGCPNFSELTLKLSSTTPPTYTPYEVCDDGAEQDGLYTFDLNATVTPIVKSAIPAGLAIEYYPDSKDTQDTSSMLPNIYTNTVAGGQDIYTRIIDGYNCYAISPFTLVVNTMDVSLFLDEKDIFCLGNSLELVAPLGFPYYKWSTGETTNPIKITAGGIYTVEVKSDKNCSANKKYDISESAPAKFTGFETIHFNGGKNEITLLYEGNGVYEFSMDNVTFQESPTFTDLVAGEYTFYANDKNGCGKSTSSKVWILDYSRLFSPNGDGVNDVWTVKNMENYQDTNVKIYNRYGKLLRELTANDPNWDGTYQGNPQIADDYWFTISYDGGKTQKGHFSLKRE